MRLTIERSALLKALNHVQSVVERRNTIPILSNVLIGAQDDAVRLTATDLDIEISEARRRQGRARRAQLRRRRTISTISCASCRTARR